jgi:membrane-bound serine protease (ClpP class)
MNPHALARPIPLLRLIFVCSAFLGLLASGVRASDPGAVVVLPTTGIVDQVMAGYIGEGIARAAADRAAAVIIRLDTPGGSLESMREIVKSELDAPLPVVVWVSPSGSRAASAGTFITLAANLAAMAPGTNIGAASPVGSGGEDIPGTEGQKVLNDAVAFITSISQTRGRPIDWAVGTVTDAKSYTVDDAIAAHAVDIKAGTIDDLMAQLNGRTVQVLGQPVTLQTAGAAVEEVPMNPFQAFLHVLADPNIAFILFTVGFYGLLFELGHPNLVTGILGAFAIIMAFIGFGSLPLNLAGLLLVGLSITLFVLEFTVTSHGLLTIGGLVAFVLGAAALYTTPGAPLAPDVAVAWPVIAVMTAITGVVVLGIVTVALRTRLMRPVNIGVAGTGRLLPQGTPAAVRRALAPTGTVYAAGEEWTARSANGAPMERGTPVRVIGQDGLVLLVENAPA